MEMNMSRAASLLLSISISATLIGCANAQKPQTTTPMITAAERAKLAAGIPDLGDEHVHMPPVPLDFPRERYINTMPEYLRDSLKGKIVLIDIWDYTCVNCIQTLPYIKQWNERYKDKGLVILGVHAPEFD
jgi:thiol-disulfide isomerase/thioredoxin